ncbi:MAG: glycerol-3-phosphate 1-O-acyltransferase PlsY [Candidatus Hydrothermia bacterium]
MQSLWIFLILLTLTYLVSGIPFGLIYAKIFKNIDVRKVGSGNIGATNVLRAAGIKVALLTALSDILKALIPVLLIRKWFSNPYYPYITWLIAISGHCFSPFLKFKGGKGVATFFGGLLALHFKTAAITFLVWLVIIVVSKYVSLGSMISVLVPALYSIIFRRPPLETIILFIAATVIIFRHKDNIYRLLKGTENKINLKR